MRQRIPARQLRPGDVIVDGTRHRQICQVEQRPGWAWPIASDGTGWAMALGDALIEVYRMDVHAGRVPVWSRSRWRGTSSALTGIT